MVCELYLKNVNKWIKELIHLDEKVVEWNGMLMKVLLIWMKSLLKENKQKGFWVPSPILEQLIQNSRNFRNSPLESHDYSGLKMDDFPSPAWSLYWACRSIGPSTSGTFSHWHFLWTLNSKCVNWVSHSPPVCASPHSSGLEFTVLVNKLYHSPLSHQSLLIAYLLGMVLGTFRKTK